MIKLVKLSSFFVTGAMLLCSCGGTGEALETVNETVTEVVAEQAPVMRDITTMELVKDMGVGINLGNTFEACGDWISPSGGVSGYERAWGSPIITEDLIKGYKEAGFSVLRVPVAWSNLMAEDYTISPELMARVNEVIDWALDAGLYVVMNIHWDGGWWEKFPTDKEECMKKYTRVWEQLSENYKDYGDYLMFESLNEEGCWNDVWNRYGGTEGKEEAYGLLNEINQKFVDIVRNSGGNNGERHLLIAGYATDIDLTCDELFKMPDDPANRCAVSVHYYTPSTFCILEKDASWGKARKTWGTEKDINELNKYMGMMKEHFVDKGIPVIIGEYGVSTGNKEPEQIRNFLTKTCEAALDNGLCPVLWDVTDVFYSRRTFKMLDEELGKSYLELAEKAKN